MNCLARSLHIAGTVTTHRTSSGTINVADWSLISCNAWLRKNDSALLKMVKALTR
jgi:hypothetical protein